MLYIYMNNVIYIYIHNMYIYIYIYIHIYIYMVPPPKKSLPYFMVSGVSYIYKIMEYLTSKYIYIYLFIIIEYLTSKCI